MYDTAIIFLSKIKGVEGRDTPHECRAVFCSNLTVISACTSYETK